MPLKLKSIINMDKRKKIYVVGGIWGLISGIIIFQFLYLFSFGGGAIWKILFEDMLFFKIILLPAYLTHQLIVIPLIELNSPLSDSSPSFLILLQLAAIVMPILIGIGISLLAVNLIEKVKKVLKK